MYKILIEFGLFKFSDKVVKGVKGNGEESSAGLKAGEFGQVGNKFDPQKVGNESGPDP